LEWRNYDLAEMYAVETKQLKRQVRRNLDRFPGDFIFELILQEYEALRSQIGASGRLPNTLHRFLAGGLDLIMGGLDFQELVE
jgi:hypothetical protein